MKKRTFYYLLCFLMMIGITAAAQEKRTVSGVVNDETGAPLSGVSISLESGKPIGITNTAGQFSVSVLPSETLLKFSSVGFADTVVNITGQTSITVVLRSVAASAGSDVVVTALGIKRQEKSLTYSVQTVNNKDLTTVQNANFINSLQGKIAGVNITQSTSGVGGSVRVVLRGNKSTRNNQPLYVVDGVPMNNTINSTQPGDEWGQSGVGYAGLDGGDGISNINPDDIASVTVLKGASAAALYGSAAANGVILITTKNGKSGKARIDVSSSWQANNRMYKTPLQFKYGQTATPSAGNPGSLDSWGDAVNSPDFVDGFFQTGLTSFNSIAISGGTDKSQTYLAYSYADNKGIVPTTNFKRNNVSFKQTNEFFNDRLTTSVNVMFINQTAHNRSPSGLYDNPLTGLYLFPRGLDFENYKQNWETFSQVRNGYVQNWWDANYDSTGGYNNSNSQMEQNPYWILNRATTDNSENRVYSNISLNYKINDWLNIQARGNIDKSYNDIDQKAYATTSTVLTANNGGYALLKQTNTQLYGDLLLMANKQLTHDLGLNATLGTSINDSKVEGFTFGTINSGDGLWIPNIFTLANIEPSNYTVSQSYQHKQVHSVFATAQLNWKQYLYLDLSGRNDWSSTFAYTPSASKGYFYYSAGLNSVLSEAFKLPDFISYSKVRISYAEVGNDVNIYSTNPDYYTISNQTGANKNTTGPKPGTYLQPEKNTSFEVGTEWRFIHDRIGFDFTYYQNNNKRQYVEIPASAGSGLNTWYLNVGNIRNRGVELSVDATPVKTKNVTWTSTVNFALNRNKIVSLSDPANGVTQDYFTLNGIGNLIYASYIKQGGSWGDIYGHFFERGEDGSIVVDANGKPLQGTDSTSGVGDNSLKKLGNPEPNYTLGWNNSITVKNFTLSFLFDGSFGGKVMSYTQAWLDANGDSKASADARDAGGVKIKATTDPSQAGTIMTIDPKTFYEGVGGQTGIGENYMYSATNIRLRELSLSYNIPVQAHWINNLTVSLIGNNLFFITKKAPFDPETSMSTGNGLQGIDTFGQPATRSFGASLKIGF